MTELQGQDSKPTQAGDGSVEMYEFKASPETLSNDLDNASVWESIKSYPIIIFYCICLSIGPLIYGFDNIIISVITAMPAFQASFGSPHGSMTIIPALWLSLWNAFIQVGVMIGSAINGPLADRFGRRTTFGAAGCISTLAVGIVYISDRSSSVDSRRGVYLAGKIILGLALGMFNSTCQTYISEIAPQKLRGPLLSFFTFFMLVGQLIAVSLVLARINIMTPSSYIVCFASQWGPSGFAVLVGLFMPESPVYLARRGKLDSARKALCRLYPSTEIDTRMRKITETLTTEAENNQNSAEISYLDCFRGTDWRRTRIVLYANTMQQCLGVTMLTNASYFLQLGGMAATHSVMISQIGVGVGLVANVISWFAMSLLGRRLILLWSTVLTGLIWVGVGIAGCFPSSVSLWFIGIAIMVVGVVYGLGVGGTYPVVAAETSSLRLRAYTQGLGFVINGFTSWLFNFILPYMFDVDQGNWGGKLGFFFAGLCLITLVVIWFEIPEMMNRTYEEVDEMFAKRLSTRAFKGYQSERADNAKKVDG
ncbi:Major facilitator superfamily domain, general substrate transporter [Penicillium italicum]|uniref:Major facilitator superfamily domain, general substrate transporter n=1 Tax=Penicillium italicum TaxID=40296 RepID=A0A0A2KGZ8_PENIT|nr:Major facilitator superfamily domain, general substrate transporter [Penicillium italicum]